jgi:hypothetical protein
MARKILIVTLAAATIAFGILSMSRSLMTYNENGKYFDGLVVYDTAALELYLLFAVLFFTATTIVILVWKKPNKKIAP